MKGPAQLIADLIENVIALNQQQGIDSGLDAKLTTAQSILDDLNQNNDGAAINKLNAFINEVEAQRGNNLTDEDADELTAATQIIIELLLL